ncbi:MAG: ABC transporter substrate-binding protein [Candidatus Nitrohelix vancouverensis]|uniref:ABC transporter substrate-binding protein n=1 Tax=Candidatus Nitrohelix vancouverensis TaxID=2705534 RepID=A0A7T0G2B8_9BACT|nr:MAG: ABC transporter substrate-binding protein [Candidatus Nitrohelix vancouverensis]
MKVVTLLPSATEIVCRLGMESSLVGVSHECDFPESISALPHLTSSRINVRASSGEIHQSVEDILKSTVSIYDLNVELLQELQPDIVITQDLCDVCAVSFDKVEEACRTLTGKEVKIISLRPRGWGDIWDDVARVAEALGAQDTCRSLMMEVQERIRTVRDRVISKKPPRRKVLAIEWIDPVMAGGLWLPEMIEMIRCEALEAKAGMNAVTLSKERLNEINPDVVIVKPCGYKMSKTLSEIEALKGAAPWSGWKAGINNETYLVDGNSYFNRPGPRLLDSLEILAACVHPDLFPEFESRYAASVIRAGGRESIPSLATA